MPFGCLHVVASSVAERGRGRDAAWPYGDITVGGGGDRLGTAYTTRRVFGFGDGLVVRSS